MALTLTALVIVSVFAAVPFTASAAESRTESVGAKSGTTGDCTWTLDDEGVLTISGNGKMQDFEWNPDLPWGQEISKVIIENGVTSIGDYSFYECTGMTSVTIPDSVMSIGAHAFFECTNLTSAKIPDSVTNIENSAFANCSGMKNVVIGNGITNINDFMFAGCYSLTNISIPDGVTSIGGCAFEECTALTNIIIPDSVTDIRDYAFDDTAWLNSKPDGLVYAGKVAYKYKGEMPENTSIILKDGTKGIANRAFESNNNLTNVIIPDSVTSIGRYAFSSCKSLVNITIPESVTSIYEAVFFNCISLTSIIIPDSVVWIGDGVFSGCTNLLSVKLSNSITRIGEAMFLGCINLNSVIIPDSVSMISNGAFWNCSNLESVKFGNNVTSIGYSSFKNCIGLKSITLPDRLSYIIDEAFKGCTGLTNVTIPNNVKIIGKYALGYNNDKKVDGFTIYGYEGSQAQKYAEDNGFEFVKLVSKEDESTGITLDIPEEMSLSATLLSGQAAADAAIGLSDGYTSIAAYNIEVTKNGEVVQPENIVKVMIPCENKNARVFRKEVDGTLTDMKAVWANGYLVFYTDHFSVYIVAEEQTVKIGDTNGDDKIDINDVTVIQRCMAEYIELTAELEAVADVNGDDKVDINDATHLQKYLAEFQGVVLGKQ